MANTTRPRHGSVSLNQAAADSPVLAHLGQLLEQSKRYMKIVDPLLPQGLKAMLQPGPVDGTVWCLLARNGAAASKVRQFLPDLELKLLGDLGYPIKIRVKVLST